MDSVTVRVHRTTETATLPRVMQPGDVAADLTASVATVVPARGRVLVATGLIFELPEGSVYPALHRLERAGLVESSWSAEEGRRRRVYALTARGRRAVGERRREWRSFSAAVNAIFGEGA